MRKQILALLLLAAVLLGRAHAQNANYLQYIDLYAPAAIDQMNRYGIPASITLAQALLESAAGTSYLAIHANNHFGIKVSGNWTGPYVVRSDDRPDDKFRVYKNAAASYEDHSLFLKNGRRYASLFSLSPRDYKGWARGLKAAGYATSPTYANRLIEIIERYDLTQYDSGKKPRHHNEPSPSRRHSKHKGAPTKTPDDYQIGYCNDNYYVRAQTGDTYKSIAKVMGKRTRKLRRYNEASRHREPETGEIVYLHKKHKRAAKQWKNKYHVIQPGESMHDIAQKYGMRLSTLYNINNLEPNFIPRTGRQLRLR